MPARRYKVWHWGRLITEGVSDVYEVAITTRAKGNAEETSSFTVANELLCARLGRALGLPIPAWAIIDRNGQPYFASLDFNVEGQRLPPADVHALAREWAALCCGILAFDAWVLMGDRHDRNISFNTTTKAVSLYDHQHAFLNRDGRDNLLNHRDGLGIASHCLADAVTTLSHLWEWIGRINELPRFFVRGTVEAAARVGLPLDDMGYCEDFLLERRTRLLDLFRAHRGMFPNVPTELWEFQTDAADYCI